MYELDEITVIGPAAPMPTKAEEWEARFKLRIISLLTVEGSQWTREQAMVAAQAEWEGIGQDVGENAMWSLDESPEDSADESMSYWEDDGDEDSQADGVEHG